MHSTWQLGGEPGPHSPRLQVAYYIVTWQYTNAELFFSNYEFTIILPIFEIKDDVFLSANFDFSR